MFISRGLASSVCSRSLGIQSRMSSSTHSQRSTTLSIKDKKTYTDCGTNVDTVIQENNTVGYFVVAICRLMFFPAGEPRCSIKGRFKPSHCFLPNLGNFNISLQRPPQIAVLYFFRFQTFTNLEEKEPRNKKGARFTLFNRALFSSRDSHNLYVWRQSLLEAACLRFSECVFGVWRRSRRFEKPDSPGRHPQKEYFFGENFTRNTSNRTQ